jgi:glycine cleavage system aminomethyltransferase T
VGFVHPEIASPSNFHHLRDKTGLGCELHHPIEMQNYLFDLLEKAGEPHGMKLVGARAQNWLRQEKSYRAFGNELGRDVTPLKADLPRFVDLTCPQKPDHSKGEFVLVTVKAKRRTDDAEITFRRVVGGRDPRGGRGYANRADCQGEM